MNKIGIVCICIIMIFVLSACNGAANDEDELLIVVSDPPTEEADTPSTPDDPPADEDDDPPEAPPEATRWGPLAAGFLDLLATRNYYLKYDLTGASIGPDGDVTIKPEDPMTFHCARQDDAYASAASDPFGDYSLIMHVVQKGNKDYYINHTKGVISVNESEKADSSDDKDDTFPVSYMEFIESGVGSVDGVSMPYEDYRRTGWETIFRFYIDGAKVAYCMGILEGEITTVRTNFEISQDIPSYMFEFPADYPFEDYMPPEKVSR